MDDLDQHLLARLRENARAPVAELARALGLSRTTIQTRLAKLERSGLIAGYSVRLSEAHAGAQVRAQLLLSVDARLSGDVEAVLRKIAAVTRLQSVSGPVDMIATVEAATVGELDAVIAQIAGVRGVERTGAAVVLSTRFER